MKNLKFSCVSLLTATALVFTSCSDNDDPKPIALADVTKPAITVEGAVKDQQFQVGGEISLKLTLSDNVELASWKIDVDPVKAEGDTDEVVTAKKAKWTDAVKDLNGNVNGKSKEVVEKKITVPADADLGKYTIVVSAKDKAGNEGVASVEIEVIAAAVAPADTTKPTITFDSDSAKAGDKIEVEGNIVIKATIADETELASWTIDVAPVKAEGETDEAVATKKAKWDSVLADLKDVATTGTSGNINKTIKVPADADLGEYTIEASVKDKAGNEESISVKIEVIAKSGS